MLKNSTIKKSNYTLNKISGSIHFWKYELFIKRFTNETYILLIMSDIPRHKIDRKTSI